MNSVFHFFAARLSQLIQFKNIPVFNVFPNTCASCSLHDSCAIEVVQIKVFFFTQKVSCTPTSTNKSLFGYLAPILNLLENISVLCKSMWNMLASKTKWKCVKCLWWLSLSNFGRPKNRPFPVQMDFSMLHTKLFDRKLLSEVFKFSKILQIIENILSPNFDFIKALCPYIKRAQFY